MTKFRSIRVTLAVAATAVISISAAQTPEQAGPPTARRPVLVGGVKKYSPAYTQGLLTQEVNRRQLEQQRKRSTWLGTKITPHPEAVGGELALQKQAAALLARLDPLPAARVGHFAWCERYPLAYRGWTGSIERMTPSPAGWLIQVRIRPKFVSQNVRMSDCFVETYEFSQGDLTYVEGTGPAMDADGGLLLL